MTDFSKATPRPWQIGNRYQMGGVYGPNERLTASTHGYSDNFSNGADVVENHANAALIVEAVNSYDANKALIAELVAVLKDIAAYEMQGYAKTRAREALAKAKAVQG